MLHRIAEVRKSQEISIAIVAKALGTTLEAAKKQEDPQEDLRVSDLIKWQSVLKVPISELLVEAKDDFSGPVLYRTRMVRLMRLAAEILQADSLSKTKSIAQNLIFQILEVMPELAKTTEKK